jgi:hypothetical protein
MRTARRPMEVTAGVILFFCLCLLLVFLVRAYNAHVGRQRDVAAAIARFHALLNDGEFRTICDEVFLCIVPEGSSANWDAFFQDVRDHAGEFQRVNESDIEVYSEPVMASVTYFSSFEKEDFKETFLLIGSGDGGFRVLGYKPEYKTTAMFPPISSPGRASCDGGGCGLEGDTLFGAALGDVLVGLPTVRYLRIFSSRFGPMPRTARKSSTLLNAP